MSFKYIDPGYGWGFATSVRNIKSNVYNPKNGVAFYSSEDCSIHLTASSARLTEFWLKFDIFLPETDTNIVQITAVYNADSKLLLGIYQSGSNITVVPFGDSDYELIGTDIGLRTNHVNTFWLYVEASDYRWTQILVVNDIEVLTEVPSIQYSGSTYGSFTFTTNSAQPISNVIISDEEIALNETIVEVGNSAVETTMTEDDGAYSSTQAGDYVLQTLNTTALYNLFGSDSKVTGMVAIAAPAYTTGEDVTQIKCRTVNGATVTDYSAQNLSSDPSAMIAEYLQLSSDTTFADLNGLKVGWVTA